MLKWMMLAAALSGGVVISDPQDPDAPETLGYREDSADRMTVPITIDGRGPFRFIIES